MLLSAEWEGSAFLILAHTLHQQAFSFAALLNEKCLLGSTLICISLITREGE